MRSVIVVVFFLFSYYCVLSQDYSYSKTHMSKEDSLAFENLPTLELPEHLKGSKAPTLPASLDNSELPYMRPVFNQDGWSCGQAAGVGYNFTYEINRARYLSADTSINQYPTHFSFNLFNNGVYDVGINYLHSFNLIKAFGSPSVANYGGMSLGHLYWMNSYDNYYEAMHNRIEEVYSIEVGDEEGLIILKNWLHNHLDGSDEGGIANFYSDLPGTLYLAEGTPEGGSSVVITFGSYSGHAMTIVGWNDSIRYDYNDDGEYTNSIDINDDGVVNMKDWEIGGLKFVNSYGDYWADSGYSYMMYKTLAEEKFDGGIWNKSVHVLDVKEDYSPLLTYKINLKHDSRHKLKLKVGVSLDTNGTWPEHIIEIPIFNFQGGDYYMQGGESNDDKTIDFGIDVTPLLSYIPNNEPAKFFFQVEEYDPVNQASGLINSFALLDYTSEVQEITYENTEIAMVDHGITTIGIIHTIETDNITIITDELPAIVTGEDYSYQLEAEGGTEPYTWELLNGYSITQSGDDYPTTNGQTLSINSSGFAVQQLDFEFPFYGEMMDKLSIHVDGFIMFSEIQYPLPYQENDMDLFLWEPMLSPFLNNDLLINWSADDGIWYEGDENSASIKWKLTYEEDFIDYIVEFTCKIYPNGNFEFYYDNIEGLSEINRVSGISKGDGINYNLSDFTTKLPSKSSLLVLYKPQVLPSGLTIDNEGSLSFLPTDEDIIFDVRVKVKDYKNIFASKKLQISDGIIYKYVIESGDNSIIEYGETANIYFTLKNIREETINNLSLSMEIDDPFISMITNSVDVGSINSDGSIEASALSFSINENIPDNYNFNCFFDIESDDDIWEGEFCLTATAPELNMGSLFIEDNDNNHLDPGETVDVQLTISNYGNSTAKNVQGKLTSSDPYITINDIEPISFGNLALGESGTGSFSISVDANAIAGHSAQFDFLISADPGLEESKPFELQIGRIPVLVVDLDPLSVSAPIITSILDNLNVQYESMYYLSNHLDDYNNIFVFLGRINNNHILSDVEGTRLKDFLLNGGNLYLEGGVTWIDDPETDVYGMFNFQTDSIDWLYNSGVVGINSTFTEGMSFDYSSSVPYYNHYLTPYDGAFTIIKSNSFDYGFVIAYDQGIYKTIGSNIDFAGLEDSEEPSTKKVLLSEILTFFSVDILTSQFETTESFGFKNINSFPNPFNYKTWIQFNLSEKETLNISLFDLTGKQIQTIAKRKPFEKGKHSLLVGQDLKPGLYFCTVKSQSFHQTIMLIKTK